MGMAVPAGKAVTGRQARGGGVRPHRTDSPRHPGPAHLYSDPLRQPVLEAGLPASPCAGTDLQPPRQRLRVRAALPARPQPDDGPGRAGDDGDDGLGPGPCTGGTPGSDALAGRRGSLRREAAAPFRVIAPEAISRNRRVSCVRMVPVRFPETVFHRDGATSKTPGTSSGPGTVGITFPDWQPESATAHVPLIQMVIPPPLP